MASKNLDSSSEGNSLELPDLYRLLKLEPLEPDVSRIEQALDDIRKKAVAAKDANPTLARRAAKVLSLGQKNLLNAERKAAYDLAWRKSFGSPAGTVEKLDASSVPAPDDLTWYISELESYLPTEDPRAVFDLAGFLQASESLPESNSAADYDKLQHFLGGAVASTATLTVPKSVSVAELLPELPQPNANSPGVSKSGLSREASTVATSASATPRTVPKHSISMAQQIRKKRGRSFLLSIVGMLLGVGLILGITLYLIRDDKSRSGVQPLAMQEQIITPGQIDPNSEVLSVPTGSGLPKVSGLEAVAGGENVNSVAMPTVPAVIPEQAVPTPAAPVATESMPAENMPPTDSTGRESMTPLSPVKLPADPVLTAEEKTEWQKLMTGVRELLGNQEFDKAQAQLAVGEKISKTLIQRQQHQRLAAVARLASEFHESLVKAVTSLSGGDSFKIGTSTPVSFVEGSATEVAIRHNGQNRTYKLAELPVGLAYGLADLQMDIAHPSSLARKAAFALVHPNSNSLTIKEARQMMTKAAAANVVEADLPEIFDEDYSLASP